MGVRYYPPLSANKARVELGISKESFEELVADKSITVKDLGGTEDFYIDHISLEKYVEKHGGKKERSREFLGELVKKEKKRILVQWGWAVNTINKRKKDLETYGGLKSFHSDYLTNDEILHYNELIKEDNARIKKEKRDLVIAELTGTDVSNNITTKKLDLSGAKVLRYSKTKEFVQKSKKKYKI